MENIKKDLKCDECNGKIIKDYIRNEYYCCECGLIYEPNHKMGHGLSGLISYMISQGFNDYISDIQLTHHLSGLALARLEVSKL